MARGKKRRRDRNCEHKHRFDSAGEAERVADVQGYAAEVAPYRCALCGHWHLGHAPKAHKSGHEQRDRSRGRRVTR